MRKYLLASAAALGLVVGANGIAHAQSAHPPSPGQIHVYLNGRLNDQIDVIGTSVSNLGGYKQNPITMSGFIRLYPGFDATTEGGLQYGVSAELRTAYTSAGTGINEGGTQTESMVVRRAYAYFGTKQAGFVRIGQSDSPWWLLSTGEYYNFGDYNGLNSDGGVAATIPGPAGPTGLFTSTGRLYTTNKVMYLSPKIMGFEAGFSYEPNSNGFKQGEACTAGTIGCASLASAPGGLGDSRRKNTITGAVKYENTFGDLGLTMGVGYIHAAPGGNSSGAPIFSITSPVTGATTNYTEYKPLSLTEVSGQVTYGGFLLGTNVKFGQANDGYTFLLPGQRQAFFYEVTGEYTMGPYTLGVTYFNNQDAGAYYVGSGYGRTQTDYGAAVGANYAMSKHLEFYAMWMYDHRHQANYTFVSSGSDAAIGNIQAQAFTVGTRLDW